MQEVGVICHLTWLRTSRSCHRGAHFLLLFPHHPTRETRDLRVESRGSCGDGGSLTSSPGMLTGHGGRLFYHGNQLTQVQSLSSVVTPTSRAPSPSSRPPSPPTPRSPGTSPATMPTPSVACTSTPLVTTPTAAPAPALTVSSIRVSSDKSSLPTRRQKPNFPSPS